MKKNHNLLESNGTINVIKTVSGNLNLGALALLNVLNILNNLELQSNFDQLRSLPKPL